MNTNAYENYLRNDNLAATIKRCVGAITKEYDFALPRGWRCIVEMETLPEQKSGEPSSLFHLDIQADKGGGSWAEAKIQTLKTRGYVVTRPMDGNELLNAIYDSGLQKTEMGQEICGDITDGGKTSSDQLTEAQLKWLVDIENGPGIAPDFGGIQIRSRCHFFEDGKALAETDVIRVAFSGAKAWQDLMFDVFVLGHIMKHFNELPDESFEFDLEPLKQIPEPRFWLVDYAIIY